MQVGSYYLPLSAISEIYDAGIDSSSMISQSANLVGKTIEGTVPEQTKDDTGNIVTKDVKVSGEVEAILVKNGIVYAKLKGSETEAGKEVAVSYITKIS